MFCPKCGTKLKDGAKFCSECGAEISVPAAQSTAVQPTTEQPVASQPVVSVSASKKPKYGIIAAAVLAVAVIAAAVFFFVSSPNKSGAKDFASYTQSSNGYLYYIGGAWGGEDGYSIKRVKEDGSEPASVLYAPEVAAVSESSEAYIFDPYLFGLSQSGNTLFFIENQYDSMQGNISSKIYSVGTDGNNLQVVYDCETGYATEAQQNITGLYVKGSKVYFTTIQAKYEPAVYYDGYVYDSQTSGELWSMDLDGSNAQLVHTEEAGQSGLAVSMTDAGAAFYNYVDADVQEITYNIVSYETGETTATFKAPDANTYVVGSYNNTLFTSTYVQSETDSELWETLITATDMKTSESKTVYRGDIYGVYGVYNNKLCVSLGNTADNTGLSLATISLDTGAVTEFPESIFSSSSMATVCPTSSGLVCMGYVVGIENGDNSYQDAYVVAKLNDATGAIERIYETDTSSAELLRS